MNRSAYWTAYRNVCMSVESWHAGQQGCDTLTQFLTKIAASPARSPIAQTAALYAVGIYLLQIEEIGSASHYCFEVEEGQPCPWHPRGMQVK